MRVYVANLGKYNEGELVGDWFEPPIDYDEMAERIGLNEFYEEYAIHDYELPFEIDEYTPIEEVNRLCEMVEDLPEYIQDNLRELQGYFSSIEDLCDHQDDIIYYPGCEDMADVARQMVEEGYISVPDHLIYYFDYEAYGRDLSMEGTFVETRNGVFEIAVKPFSLSPAAVRMVWGCVRLWVTAWQLSITGRRGRGKTQAAWASFLAPLPIYFWKTGVRTNESY